MKLTRYALIAVLGCIWMAGSANAQSLRQPASVRPAALDYDYYYQEEPSPSDRQAVQPSFVGQQWSVQKMADPKGMGCDDGCTDGCGHFHLLPGAHNCEPWRVFPELPGCFSLTGWVDVGGTANGRSTPSRYNGPVTFNDRREVQMNQLYAVLEREADTGGCGWDWGARVDLMYGTDFIFNQVVGWELNPDGTPGWNSGTHYGFVTPQAYGEVAYNNLSLKVGRFYTIMGYEVVPAPQNFFYSHAYTMQYGKPFYHTGGLFTWTPSDRWTLYGGLVNGWDRFDGVSDKLAFLGGATYTPDHGRYSLTGTIISGEEQDNNGGPNFSPRTFYSMVFNLYLTERWEYVLQHDLGWQEDYFAAGADAEWYGINQYLFYTLNDCWRFGGRLEWFRDDDGVRVTGVRPTNPYPGGSPGNFWEVTLGARWTPTANLIVRPEVRWDWYDGIGTLPYNDNQSDDQFTAALDVILLF